MTRHSYPTVASSSLSALLFAAACGLAACAPDDDANGNPYVPPTGFAQDSAVSPIVTGDAGVGPTTQNPPVATGSDSGSVTPVLDAGSTPPAVDSGSVVAPQGDSGTVTAEGGAPDSGAPMMHVDQGMGDGKDVVCIGDSWMSYSGTEGIEYSVQKASKQTYRKYGVSGTKLLDEVIPNQYETAKKAGPIKTVIMTGGGNDIIQDKLFDCGDSAFGKTCTDQIDKVATRLTALWAEMGKDGVQDVLIVGYTTKADILEPLTKSAQYSNMKIPPLCAAVAPPLRCHVLDSDMAAPDLKLRDGIHPDSAGFDKIGAAVWELMKSEGMRR